MIIFYAEKNMFISASMCLHPGALVVNSKMVLADKNFPCDWAVGIGPKRLEIARKYEMFHQRNLSLTINKQLEGIFLLAL